MIETTVVLVLIWLVSVYIAYEQGHFNGRKMVRDEWIKCGRRANPDSLPPGEASRGKTR